MSNLTVVLDLLFIDHGLIFPCIEFKKIVIIPLTSFPSLLMLLITFSASSALPYPCNTRKMLGPGAYYYNS